ncbi:TetR family transcriptional regulator [Pseudoduganella sp. UC29_106]|uniref:TetR family transcriptional regulator n=1 Tax=Pseudoduganella sp. UC29_106 TaxID=3374553 RepID=UPI0037579BCC
MIYPTPDKKGAGTAFRERVHAQTRTKLWGALERLRSGNVTVVPVGTKISAKSLAKEAGVDRATLYRSHSVVLDEIRQTTSQIENKEPTARKRRNTANRLAEYRMLAEEAQHQVALLARHQYDLSVQVEELMKALELKDAIIQELNERLASLTTERRIHSIS